jgi:hypothetical protein
MGSRSLPRRRWMVTWGGGLVVTGRTTPRERALETGDGLVPIPEDRGQQLRRLAFGQPRAGGDAQLAQQRRLFLRGRVLTPRRLHFDQPGHPQMPRIVFRQPLRIGQRQGVAQPQRLRLAAHLHHLPGVWPIRPQPQRPILGAERQDPGPLPRLHPAQRPACEQIHGCTA